MVQTSIAAWLFKKTNTAQEPVNRVEDTKEQGLELPPIESKPPISVVFDRNPDGPSITSDSSIARSTSVTSLQLPTPPLPTNVSIEPITASNVTSFRRLTALLLPIPYPEGFYDETVDDPVISSLSKLAFWHDKPIRPDSNNRSTPSSTHEESISAASQSQLVAAIRCRLLRHPPGEPKEETPILYISTITTLAPFRRHALGSHLLHGVAATAVREYGATAIMAHVWEANEDAMEWYKKRGFRIIAKVDGYYKRLAPRTSAWLLRKDISALEMLEWDSGVSSQSSKAQWQ